MFSGGSYAVAVNAINEYIDKKLETENAYAIFMFASPGVVNTTITMMATRETSRQAPLSSATYGR